MFWRPSSGPLKTPPANPMKFSLNLGDKLTAGPLWWHNATKSFFKYLNLGLRNNATIPTRISKWRQKYTRIYTPFSPTPEIIQSIITAFDPLQDRLILCKLMLVSHSFRKEAEIALYQNVGLGMTTDQRHRFLNAISRFPRLGGLVRGYEFDCPRDVTTEMLAAFKLSIPLMVDLKEFRFTGDKETPLAYDILSGIDSVRTQLKSLYWRGSGSDEKHIAHFLSQQKALTKLNIICTGNTISDFSNHHLQVLTGNSWTIRSLLPGRNITELYWIPDLELYTTTLNIIQPALDAFSRLRILSFGGGAVNKLLSHILPYLTSVEILELITMTGHDLPGQAHRIPNLRVLILSKGQNCISPTLRQHQNHHQIAGELFCMNRNIDHVDINVWNPLQVRADGGEYYYRWSRYSSRVKIVSAEEALAWKRI